jgi:hypothetical protein
MKIVKLQTKSFRDVFIRVSSNVLDESYRKDGSSIWIAELKNELEQPLSYLEWNGELTESTSFWMSSIYGNTLDRMGYSHETIKHLVELDPQVAQCLSIKNGDLLLLQWHFLTQHEISQYAANRIFVEPSSEDDWEILELNARIIEDCFLQQVRVVSENSMIPLYLQEGTTIKIKVTSTEPKHIFVIARVDTEIIVAPKKRALTSPLKENDIKVPTDVCSLRVLPEEMSDFYVKEKDSVLWTHSGTMRLVMSEKMMQHTRLTNGDIVRIRYVLLSGRIMEAASIVMASPTLDHGRCTMLSPALKKQLGVMNYRNIIVETLSEHLKEYIIDEVTLNVFLTSINPIDTDIIQSKLLRFNVLSVLLVVSYLL